ncbi:MAG: C39 family peptidase [Patescibacteria group bacterium]
MTSNHGTGIALTDELPENRVEPIPYSDGMILSSWVGGDNTISLNSFICSEENTNCGDNYPEAFYFSDESDFSQFNTVRINYIDNKYLLYYNDNLLFTSAPATRFAKYVWIGSPLNPSTLIDWSSLAVDYIRVTKLPDNPLDVPKMYQNDDEWSDLEYNHANSWIDQYNEEYNDTAKPSIGRWGCAMSSAAMLLKYFGVTKVPSGEELTPLTLNNWLSSVSGGYLGWGHTNWLKISAMTKEVNELFGEPKLEFKHITQKDSITFEEHIDSEQPEILKIENYWKPESSHFVVGMGYNDDEILINDPLGKYFTVNKAHQVSQRSFYYPTNSDFSGMYLIAEGDVDLLLENSSGDKVGIDKNSVEYFDIPNATYSVQNDLITRDNSGSGRPYLTKHLLLTHIVPDSYTLKVVAKSDTTYNLHGYIQNSDASSKPFDPIGNELEEGEVDTFNIVFTNSDANSIDPVEEPITFESIRQYINNQYEEGNIRNKGIRNLLLTKLSLSEKFYTHNRLTLARLIINTEIRVLGYLPKRMVSESTANNLKEMLEELMNSWD